MTKNAVEVENLSKLYRLGDDAKQHRISEMFMPWKKFSDNTNELWALKDISFKIEDGESVGIIGRNGAGKSTLLKILSRITAPTTGRVQVRGRVGTLLEVGTGFHPELSGRDNIFLSGTILGLRYAQIKKHLDEIIDFAGVEKFIDTPVKRYSSGMQVKLAFAVALYLEPEILIVDEVLAVGDLAFQRKSLKRLNEVTGREGRTVLFVSHSLESVKKSCQRVIVLEDGRMKFDGDSVDGIDVYRDSIPFEPESIKQSNLKDRLKRTSGEVRFGKIEAFNDAGQSTWAFSTGETARLQISYEVQKAIESLYVLFRILTPTSDLDVDDQHAITNLWMRVSDDALKAGTNGILELVLPELKLRSGQFPLYIVAADKADRINYDVIDTNVNLPNLRIKTSANHKFERMGYMALDHHYVIRYP
jgi:lipopolysaccharide transport system ATP-binding protein